MNRRSFRIITTSIGMMAWALVFLIGCATLKDTKGGVDSGKTAVKAKEAGPAPVYYDFGDVLIPSELKVNRKLSFVYRTEDLAAGVLSLTGRVEINSLISFFENNMAKDNWKTVSSFKSPQTLLLFQKTNRWCVIMITEGDFSTQVKIWVAPIVDDAGSGVLK